MEIVKPLLCDIDSMRELLRPSIEEGVILDRSADEIASAIRSYHIARLEGTLVGMCALHIHSSKLAEIRSLKVDMAYQRQGVGSGIIKEALKEAVMLGVKEVLVLTYEQRLFEKLGFVEVSKAEIPNHKIWTDCIKCKHFPVCNEIALIKKL